MVSLSPSVVAVAERRTLVQSILCPPTVLLNRDKLFGRKGSNKASIIDTDGGDEGLSCSLCHWSQVEERDVSASSHLTEAVRTIIGIEKDDDLVFCPFCCRQVANLLGVKAEIDRLEEKLMDMIEGLHTLLTKKKDPPVLVPQIEDEEVQSEVSDPDDGPWIKVDRVYSMADLEEVEGTYDDGDWDSITVGDAHHQSSKDFEEALANSNGEISVNEEETSCLEGVDFQEPSFHSPPSAKRNRARGLKRAMNDPNFANRRYICHLCPFRSHQKQNRDSHLITHLPMDQRPGTVPCPHCRRLFSCPANLRTHLKTHARVGLGEKIKSHKCDPCQRSYTSKQNLLLHMKSAKHLNNDGASSADHSTTNPAILQKDPSSQGKKKKSAAAGVATDFKELKQILASPTLDLGVELSAATLTLNDQLQNAVPEKEVRIFRERPGATAQECVVVEAIRDAKTAVAGKEVGGNTSQSVEMTSADAYKHKDTDTAVAKIVTEGAASVMRRVTELSSIDNRFPCPQWHPTTAKGNLNTSHFRKRRKIIIPDNLQYILQRQHPCQLCPRRFKTQIELRQHHIVCHLPLPEKP